MARIALPDLGRRLVVNRQITEAALVARVNRRLEASGRKLRRIRPGPLADELGRYVVMDSGGGPLVSVDIGALCKELGVARDGLVLEVLNGDGSGLFSIEEDGTTVESGVGV